jgi:uncharacterized damage-inducible protein DinB
MSMSDSSLRQHLVELLKGGSAHATFDDAIADWPEALRGKHAAHFPHTAWQLLEHMRLAQFDILDFSRNSEYKELTFPDDYWPKHDAPPTASAWEDSVAAFRRDLQQMQQVVQNPAIDLYARIPWGSGQTVLREALLVADHNAYHLGQLVALRRALGAWQA